MYYPVSLVKTICEKTINGEYDISEFSSRLITVCFEGGEKYYPIEKMIEKILTDIEMCIYCESPEIYPERANKYAKQLIELIGNVE